MTTDNQLQANRRNAEASTGPRTPEGKARSSQNARKHGLSSSQLKIHDSELETFHSMELELRAAIQPQGEMENTCFDLVLFAQWNLRRARILEQDYFAEDPTAQNEARLRNIDRYARRHETSFHRAMRELTRLQTERACRDAAPVSASAQNEANPAPLASVRSVMDASRKHNALLEKLLTASLSSPLPAAQLPEAAEPAPV